MTIPLPVLEGSHPTETIDDELLLIGIFPEELTLGLEIKINGFDLTSLINPPRQS